MEDIAASNAIWEQMERKLQARFDLLLPIVEKVEAASRPLVSWLKDEPEELLVADVQEFAEGAEGADADGADADAEAEEADAQADALRANRDEPGDDADLADYDDDESAAIDEPPAAPQKPAAMLPAPVPHRARQTPFVTEPRSPASVLSGQMSGMRIAAAATESS